MEQSLKSSTQKKGFNKVLRGLDMTLFTVSAILVIETLAPSASIGPSSIAWWIITLVLFFISIWPDHRRAGNRLPWTGRALHLD